MNAPLPPNAGPDTALNATPVQPLASETLLDAVDACIVACDDYRLTACDDVDYDTKHERRGAAVQAVSEIPCASFADQCAKLELFRDSLEELWNGVHYRGADTRDALDDAVDFGLEALTLARSIAERAARGEFHDLRGIPAFLVG